MLKACLSCLVLLISMVLVETSLLSNVVFIPVIPDFVLICNLYIAVNNGKNAGQLMGFTSGLFLDFLSSAPFGMNCLIRTLIGYFSGALNKLLNLNSIFVAMVLGLVTTLVKAFFIFLISLLYPRYVNSYNIFSMTFVIELGLNTILTPFMFKFLNCFSNFIVYESKEID